MANGEEVEFDLDSELSIPDHPEQLRRAAMRAPAQVAFWNYQTERVLARLRKAEDEVEAEEGKAYLLFRHYYEHEECRDPTEAMIRARMAQDPGIRRFRIAMRARKKEYGETRSVRDAVQHRSLMLRTLIANKEPT